MHIVTKLKLHCSVLGALSLAVVVGSGAVPVSIISIRGCAGGGVNLLQIR